MAKKIYDIMPPKVAQKLQAAVKNLEKAPKRRRAPKKSPAVLAVEKLQQKAPISLQKRGFPKKEVLIGGGVVALLLAVYLYGGLARATVEISPVTQTLSFQEKISVDTSYENVNLLKKIIPARLLVEEKQGSQEFPATGSASNDGKATGTIKVYNKVSPATPITLKAGTHFLSDSGKYFISLDRIIIPAMKKSTAGSIDVRVQAEESGTEYNIGASKFSVPKLSGTAYYYSIWAESKSAMTGGYTGSVKKVTRDDIAVAKNVLTQKLLEDAEILLRQKIGPNEVMLDGAISKITVSATADAKEGAAVNTFRESAAVKVSALVFKKEDLQKFAKLDAESKLVEGDVLREESLEASYNSDTIDMQAGILKMNLKVSAVSYQFIDGPALADSLTAKTSNQMQAVVGSQYGAKISAVNIRFWPFWVSKSPKDKHKIKIELIFE